MFNRINSFYLVEEKGMGNMMKGSRVFMLLLVIIMVVLSMEEGVKLAKAAGPSAAQCKEERRLGINACKPVVYGKLPTPECCERVRVTHIECVCTVVTPKLAALIDVNRAIRLIEGCGRRVPRHFKCGSKYSVSPLSREIIHPYRMSPSFQSLYICYKILENWTNSYFELSYFQSTET